MLPIPPFRGTRRPTRSKDSPALVDPVGFWLGVLGSLSLLHMGNRNGSVTRGLRSPEIHAAKKNIQVFTITHHTHGEHVDKKISLGNDE